MRLGLLLLLAASLVVALGFLAGILGGVGSGVALHEIAGAVLLLLLAPALAVALALRPIDRRPLLRVAVALVALVLAGATGAALATGSIPGEVSGLPIVPLAVVLVGTMDGIRVTRAVRIPPALP
jgi:hypothetical protein